MSAVKLDQEIRDGLSKFIADRAEPTQTRLDEEAAVNIIVRDWLQAQGYLPLPLAANEIKPALDAADIPRP